MINGKKLERIVGTESETLRSLADHEKNSFSFQGS